MPVLTPAPERETTAQHPNGDEQGAVLVVVGVSLLALLLIAAFVVDLGLAYTERRQVQTAADAAVLAMANTYVSAPGDCHAIRDLMPAPVQEGREFTATNLDIDVADVHIDATEIPEGGVVATYDIGCDDDEETLQVTWEITASVPASLAAAAGIDEVVYGASATAEVRVPGSITGADVTAPPPADRVLPYLVCSDEIFQSGIPDMTPTGPVVKVQWHGTVPDGDPCPGADPTATDNEWGLLCPEDSSHNLVAKTKEGCQDEIGVVDPQTATSPGTRHDELVAACTPASADSDCLQGTSARFDQADLRDSWGEVLGRRVFFPVFCARPTCNPPPVVDDGELHYPIQHLVGAIVCGYDWGGGDHDYDTTNAACLENPYGPPPQGPPDNQDYVLLQLVHIPVPSLVAPRDCALGSACDIGPRRVYLVE